MVLFLFDILELRLLTKFIASSIFLLVIFKLLVLCGWFFKDIFDNVFFCGFSRFIEPHLGQKIYSGFILDPQL